MSEQDNNRIVMTRNELIEKFSHYFTVSYKSTLENGIEEFVVIEHLGKPNYHEDIMTYKDEREAVNELYNKFYKDFEKILDYHYNELKKYNNFEFWLASVTKSKKSELINHHITVKNNLLKLKETKGHQLVKYLKKEYKVFKHSQLLKDKTQIHLVNIEDPPKIQISTTRVEKLIPLIKDDYIDIKLDVIHFELSGQGQGKYINVTENKEKDLWTISDDLFMFVDREKAHDFSIEILMNYQSRYTDDLPLLNKQIQTVANYFKY